MSIQLPLPFRLGATSYVIPDHLAANAAYLSSQVMDMELVLFDLDDGTSNLPDPEMCSRLKAAAHRNNFSYTVHLPLDIHVGNEPLERDISIRKAVRTIRMTQELEPWAYIAHLDGREWISSTKHSSMTKWWEQAARTFEILIAEAGSPHLLCLENLEHYPMNFIDPLLEWLPISRCVDIGHLWVDGHDPMDVLPDWLERARVVHLHGIGTGDHQSLIHTPREQLYPVLDLLAQSYTDVVTLECFGEEDFSSSLATIEKWYAHNHRFGRNPE
jgi:sugar phosphate isomerase/epimerase